MEESKVHCAIVDVSKAFDQINHNLLINGLHETSLLEQVQDSLDYMLNNTEANVLTILRQRPGELEVVPGKGLFGPHCFFLFLLQ